MAVLCIHLFTEPRKLVRVFCHGTTVRPALSIAQIVAIPQLNTVQAIRESYMNSNTRLAVYVNDLHVKPRMIIGKPS